MTWQPLTQTYCAESYENGVLIAHTFDATDDETAQALADSNGWTLLGVLVHEEDVADEFVALVEKTTIDPIVH